MDQEVRLMKGNEAIAHAAIRYGFDGYFGYPITPQSEVLETLESEMPWNTTGMVVLQAESELASINMVYGGAATGKAVMTSSSSPGISLMMEGVSYIAAFPLPAVIVNVMRGGPGLGTIQPSQADYFQATKGGGHGDYHCIVVAPSTVQEMCDFVGLAKDLAFKHRMPVMILADGVVGQMMEKVKLPEFHPRRTEEEIREQCPWAACGRTPDRKGNVVTTLEMDPERMEVVNEGLQQLYRKVEAEEVRYEEHFTEDAEYLVVAFGTVARIALKAVEDLRAEGVKVGILRPITLWPFPYDAIDRLSKQVKGMLCVEMNAGQMIEDVKLGAKFRVPVYHTGRMGGIVPDPTDVYEGFMKHFPEAKK